LGYGLIIVFVIKVLRGWYNILYPFFIATPIADWVKFSGGKWAVVTGSTDGMGKAYAFELARKGMNVCLVSRSEQKLRDTAAEISAKCPKVQIKTVAFDFSTANVADYEKMFNTSALKDIDVGVLVNNVGMSYEYPNYFTEVSLNVSRDVTVVNTLSVIAMTKLFLSKMVERHSGVIINISSASHLHPTPLLGVYAATKTYVDYVSNSLAYECSSKGVTIQCVAPAFVATKMSGIRKARLMAPDPDSFAQSALRTVSHVEHTHGCWQHQFQCEFVNYLPRFASNFLATKMLLSSRAAAIKRAAKKE